jgi:hypothetical protein
VLSKGNETNGLNPVAQLTQTSTLFVDSREEGEIFAQLATAEPPFHDEVQVFWTPIVKVKEE